MAEHPEAKQTEEMRFVQCRRCKALFTTCDGLESHRRKCDEDTKPMLICDIEKAEELVRSVEVIVHQLMHAVEIAKREAVQLHDAGLL